MDCYKSVLDYLPVDERKIAEVYRNQRNPDICSRHIYYYFLSFIPSLKASPTRSVTL